MYWKKWKYSKAAIWNLQSIVIDIHVIYLMVIILGKPCLNNRIKLFFQQISSRNIILPLTIWPKSKMTNTDSGILVTVQILGIHDIIIPSKRLQLTI